MDNNESAARPLNVYTGFSICISSRGRPELAKKNEVISVNIIMVIILFYRNVFHYYIHYYNYYTNLL